MGNATIGQLRGNLSGFKKAVRRRDVELKRLRAAIKRIDAINDNPACFNVEINDVCDKIIRPELAK